MSPPRIVVPGKTYALTHRTAFRKLLLTPLMPELHQGLLYILGRAAQEKKVAVHHVVQMPTHGHWIVTPTLPNLPDFAELFFRESSKFIKTALVEYGFEAPEKVWNDSRYHAMQLVDAEAQLIYLHYQDVNTVEAGLVERVEQYPGVSTDPGLMAGGALAMKRPPFYVSKRNNPEEFTFHLSLPPVLKDAFGSSEPVIHHLRKARRSKEQACKKRGGRVLGPLAVTRQNPWSEPRSPRRYNTEPVPTFMVAGSTALRVQCARETTAFRQQSRESWQAYKEGGDPVFPAGTYAMRVRHGMRVAAPAPDAVLAVDGLSLLMTPDGEPLSRDARRHIISNLRQEAQATGEADDTLAQRIVEGKADEVSREHATRVLLTEVPKPQPEGAPLNKRVVLRDATRASRRRRKRKQTERRRLEVERNEDDEELGQDHEDDLDPPPD